jgi:adenylate kinase family enzyme
LRTLPARLARADTIVWIDVNRLMSLRRIVWRTIVYYGRNRPDMTPDCPERFDLEFLRYIWSFQTHVRPRLQAAVDRRGLGTRLHVLRTPRETRGFITSM